MTINNSINKKFLEMVNENILKNAYIVYEAQNGYKMKADFNTNRPIDITFDYEVFDGQVVETSITIVGKLNKISEELK